MLVHGAPDRAGSFDPVLRHLADRRVLVYDRRGYGRSLRCRPAEGMRDHAEDLLAIVASLDAPPVVVAHSFGSNPTMLAATLKPDAFAALGLWEPPFPWLDWWPQVAPRLAAAEDPEAMIEDMYRRLLGDEAWERWPPAVQAERRAEGRAFRTDMASEVRAPFAFDDVTVRALVGYGTATSDVHGRGARWLVTQLPDARLHVVPGAGHFAPRTHPVDYAAFVRAASDELR